jgi:hypothetical protein
VKRQSRWEVELVGSCCLGETERHAVVMASLMLLPSRHSRAPRRAPSAGAQSQAFTSQPMRMRRQILHDRRATLAVCPSPSPAPGIRAGLPATAHSRAADAQTDANREPLGAPTVMDDIFSASKPRSLKRALSRQARPSVRRHTTLAKRRHARRRFAHHKQQHRTECHRKGWVHASWT